MNHRYFTIAEIYEWYKNNVDTKLSFSLLEHMINDGIITRLPNKRYLLTEVNGLLLQKEDCTYIKNSDGKFILKNNRKILLEKFEDQIPQKDNTKFKITKLEGNKLKLSKK